ncbi:MAG: hypothetical protein CL920_26510 [Deltaproteobacteria bacterium]|nr:hypothetical protein [Deltaproteobacteria bacterium]
MSDGGRGCLDVALYGLVYSELFLSCQAKIHRFSPRHMRCENDQGLSYLDLVLAFSPLMSDILIVDLSQRRAM